MKTLTIEHETDTAHRLSCHQGKCANLHGHRYKFVVTIDVQGSIETPEKFMDFYSFKRIVRDFLDQLFDHGTILANNEANEPLIRVLTETNQKLILWPYEPTVESMVDWVAHDLNQLKALEGRLYQLTIYETPTNYCTWTRKD